MMNEKPGLELYIAAVIHIVIKESFTMFSDKQKEQIEIKAIEQAELSISEKSYEKVIE